ncbi:hypothetical protein I302_108872 [Kwoniella bestiolae CBS 10118]|uniref:Uncharacterized protein n=1 Tax=Kwoniella bestiolae CBS 10118 TaxID=1296100 RepID=A0A1B9FUB6_9TREE|nr:hypothetical protein I302_08009 [Kwoniella bestiolae CBS 10118]OCF22362.1 hypothetical protein I302_08009 [Kwoniella bestiolae CBS 10118]
MSTSTISSSSTRNHPHQTRYHPYSLDSNLLAYRHTGPPSIASTSTTSSAPSIASSSATIVPSLTLQRQDGLRIKVNTSVAPSSHIWDEFYNEHGRPQPAHHGDGMEIHEEEPEATTPRLPPSSFQHPPEPDLNPANYNFNEDTTISELLSMFELPINTEAQTQIGTSSHHLPATNTLGDYPGAEFLNLPDTASTMDAQFPGLDEFDFTQFNFDNPPIPAANEPSNSTATLENGHSEEVATQSSGFDRAQNSMEIGLNSSNSNSNSDTPPNNPNTSTSQIEPSPSVQPSTGGEKHTCTYTVPLPLQTLATSNTPIVGEASPIPNEENNKTSSTLLSSNNCTPLVIGSSSSSSSSYPHLKRMKMKALSTDKDVIRFQKEVLNVAAKFYTDLADVFGNTPSETIKLGMSRTGVLVEDDTISDVLEDIKSLCARLTAKASDIPGYPADDDDVNMSGDEVPPPTLLVPPVTYRSTHKTAQKGSSTEPIDLTASTPRSEGVTPAAPPHVPLPPSIPVVAASQKTPARINHVSTPRSSPPYPGSRRKRLHDPFTPESLGAGPSSVLPTANTSPLCPGSTPSMPFNAYTPAHSLPAQTPLARMLLDLPPLPNPTNRVIHGPWKPSEVERLRTLVAFSQDVEDNAPIDHTDWSWVVDNFGGTRNRHQVLIKAVELGLRETSTHHSRRIKQKGYRDALAAMEDELGATSTKPLPSPLPPLLPSAQITPRPPRPDAAARRHSEVAPVDHIGPGESGKLVKTSLMLGEGGRRESDGGVVSEPTLGRDTSLHPIKAAPRALDLSSPRDRRDSPSQAQTRTSPIRPPHTPRSKLNTMGFKPYAHPSSAPPQPLSTRHGWRLVNDGRPSVISPTFGRFAMKGLGYGYQYRLGAISGPGERGGGDGEGGEKDG